MMDIILQIAGGLLIGLLIGIVLNYLADVLPRTRRFSQPVCSSCGETLHMRTYLRLEACPSCGSKRSRRTIWVLILAGLGFSLLAALPPIKLGFWLAVLLFTYFSLVTIIDLEHRAILNETTVIGFILGIGYGLFLHGWQMTLIGGAAGFGIMYSFYLLGIVFTRVMARIRKQEIDEVALGFGDVYLSTILGLILGWPQILAGLFFAILAGGLVSLVIILAMVATKRYNPFTPIPYGPFLIIAATFFLWIAK